MPEGDNRPIPGTIYTFYSYKGGVGRSMALVNVGVLLSLFGKRVLLVDWDLEAPGLEVHFRQADRLVGDPESVPGIVDLLEARMAGKVLPWQQCLLRAEFLGKSLDIVSAGSRTADYRGRIQRLDWEALYSEHKVGNYINELREEWRAAYDFVLVDSRTGITDIGDICTVLLPDAIVLMFVTNYQNVEGVKKAMARAVAARKRLPVNRAKLHAIPLPARDEVYSEYEKSLEWKRIYAREFGDLFREWLPREVTPEDALNKLFIPYVTNWSFGERIPVLENARETQDPTTIGAAYKRVANLLANALDWYSLDGNVAAGDLQGAQLDLLRELERADKLAAVASRSSRRLLAITLAAVALAAFATWALLIRPQPSLSNQQSIELFDGRQLLDAGKTDEARKVFHARASELEGRLKASPGDSSLMEDIVTTNHWLGSTLERQGRSTDALASFRSSQAMVDKLVAQDPTNAGWQRDLAISHLRIGGILKDQAKPEEALASFRSAKAIVDKLTARDPSNTGWQLDLAVSHNWIGGILQNQGKLEEALASRRLSKAIMDKLTAFDSSNADWQGTLAGVHTSLGRILRDQGKLEEALASFRSDKAIIDKLTARDSTNTQWQFEAAVAHSWIGDILQHQGKLEEALASYRSRKDIMDKLTAHDPSNTNWQSELASSHDWIGLGLRDQGKLEEALASLRLGKAIKDKLTAQDPSNTGRQRELALSHLRIGGILQDQGKLEEALASFRSGKAIMDKLTAIDPSNADWQGELSLTHNQIGGILRDQGKVAEALKEFVEAKGLLGRLGAANSSKAGVRRDFVEILRKEAATQLKAGDPKAALGSVAQGETLYRKIRIEKGAENFWQPEGARVLMQRGEILRALGDHAGAIRDLGEARTLLARLLKSSPGHAEWRRDMERLTVLQK